MTWVWEHLQLQLHLKTANVDTLSVASNGVITVVTTSAAKNLTLKLSPQNVTAGNIPEGPVTWSCTVEGANNNKYVPTECRKQ